MTRIIRIAAAVIIDDKQQMLVVRKRGTSAFMQPGGKIDSGEQPVDALVRELYEELGLVTDPNDLLSMGNYEAPAANEPGYSVDCALYRLVPRPEYQVIPAAEIDIALWISVLEPCDIDLAPLTRDFVLPLARQDIQSGKADTSRGNNAMVTVDELR